MAALLALVALGAAAWFALSLFQPLHGDGEGTRVELTIPQGATLGEIANQLEENGVIRSAGFFELRARLAGRSGELRPGSYELQQDLSYLAALDALEQGVPPNVVQVTVPEGRSRREIAPLVKRLPGNYVRATRRSPLLSPRRYGAPGARSLEGFLFPATYELKKGQPVRRLVNKQLTAFKRNFGEIDLSYARRRNLTPYDVLTIASLVEREATLAKERPIIASVIYNRLRQDIRLDIDATTRFAVKQLDAAAQAVRDREPVALQHPGGVGPAARADRQPGPRLDPGGGEAGADRLPLLCGGHLRRGPPPLRRHERRVPPLRERVRGRARAARRQGPHQLLTHLAGVLGHPVGHSRSPAMMNAAFAALELDWRYVKLPVPPELFAETVRALARLRLPGRQRDHSPQARCLRAGRRALARRRGHRRGQHAGLPGRAARSWPTTPTRPACWTRWASPCRPGALVLGAGGSARAAAWALREAGLAVTVWNRTPERAAQLAADLGVSQVARARAGRADRQRHLGGSRRRR